MRTRDKVKGQGKDQVQDWVQNQVRVRDRAKDQVKEWDQDQECLRHLQDQDLCPEQGQRLRHLQDKERDRVQDKEWVRAASQRALARCRADNVFVLNAELKLLIQQADLVTR